MKIDHILIILASLLMAIHVIYGTLISNESMVFAFSLFVFPYLVVSFIWFRLKEIYKISILIVFLILEFNHVATDTIPALVKTGLTTSTLDAVFYIPCILFLAVTLLLLIFQRIGRQRDEANHPYL